ncbi:predicted protein [Chaetoceros tenuissimus]|uniref:Uncharacterized protein n=1 Tax=Chaetoceros tenuissimus TaxID=426638 RepID=A0AAD3CE99_9STRA|nr:predicted protein [Chaetoceros tenuissimus]
MYNFEQRYCHVRTYRKCAVGLVEGGPSTNIWMNGHKLSEELFPKDRLLKSLSVSIQDAEASKPDDHKHILNALVGRKGFFMKFKPRKHHQKYIDLNNAVRGVFASTYRGIQIAYDDGKKGNWNATLHAMKHSVTKYMELTYLNDFKADVVADIFHYLPIALEQLGIDGCPHGKVAMDAFLDWLENTSTNLKELRIYRTCIGEEFGGKECSERLARFLARKDCKIEHICLQNTDLVGSRNVHTWIECLEKNQSLKRKLHVVSFEGMGWHVKNVGVSELPNTSIDVPADGVKGKIYWDGKTFPDATLPIEQEKALEKTLSKNAGGFNVFRTHC